MKDSEMKQRDTRQRRMVYEAVAQRRDHPSADEIYQDVHTRDSRISKATVYRNLNVLSENREINHVRVPGADRYDHTTENHYHIICLHCGKVIDSPIRYIADNDAIVEEDTGFRISRHRTVFEGVCPECQKAAEKE